MTNTLIIYCHPYNQSFNHAVLESVLKGLSATEKHPQVVDLYADHFNPCYDQRELQLYGSGETTDPQVAQYLTALKKADRLIIITPIWWNDIPAILKGFFDKVMKRGPERAYTPSKYGVAGHLTNIQKSLILTTSTSPTVYLRLFGGNAIKGVLIGATLKQLGVRRAKWQNFGGITSSSPAVRTGYLSSVTKLISAWSRPNSGLIHP
ncbi:NAD(P)H-dependent oxidoreductase [Lacticaseibacillus pantheris]|jgi:putative NADPH-quinone reductase|uniref:NAD(P)H-dependent oxidoreductase n=1 Tax=Lacticaseibacillus pantheris TaxID=171523 RepID=UPI0025970048|nr:NAD(P)H-dependent oxidoreductase [Lacticaseibacillus pantheris]WKF85496.1 NAD(P)H-dependent oxidoreductase [Lacticaseibacillus pantheris]